MDRVAHGVEKVMPRFSETLLDHARHPHNFGRDTEANAVGRADLDGRPPVVEVYLRIEEGIIQRASFHATGCGVTIAAGSALTDVVLGRKLEECREVGPDQISERLEGVPTDKTYCIEVAIAAMRAIRASSIA